MRKNELLAALSAFVQPRTDYTNAGNSDEYILSDYSKKVRNISVLYVHFYTDASDERTSNCGNITLTHNSNSFAEPISLTTSDANVLQHLTNIPLIYPNYTPVSDSVIAELRTIVSAIHRFNAAVSAHALQLADLTVAELQIIYDRLHAFHSR